MNTTKTSRPSTVFIVFAIIVIYLSHILSTIYPNSHSDIISLLLSVTFIIWLYRALKNDKMLFYFLFMVTCMGGFIPTIDFAVKNNSNSFLFTLILFCVSSIVFIVFLFIRRKKDIKNENEIKENGNVANEGSAHNINYSPSEQVGDQKVIFKNSHIITFILACFILSVVAIAFIILAEGTKGLIDGIDIFITVLFIMGGLISLVASIAFCAKPVIVFTPEYIETQSLHGDMNKIKWDDIENIDINNYVICNVITYKIKNKKDTIKTMLFSLVKPAELKRHFFSR